jgi:DNA-directed RNA polymerase subunit RPC12/RpoP
MTCPTCSVRMLLMFAGNDSYKRCPTCSYTVMVPTVPEIRMTGLLDSIRERVRRDGYSKPSTRDFVREFRDEGMSCPAIPPSHSMTYQISIGLPASNSAR